MNLVSDGKKWRVNGAARVRWISHRTFPAKWKAEIALRVCTENGRFSDYVKAIRTEREKRSSLQASKIGRDREVATRRNDAPLPPSTVIKVCRQPGHPGIASVLLESLCDFHVREMSGGVGARFSRPMLCARIWCNKIPDLESFGHSCAHGPGPHEIVVCLTKANNRRAVYDRLLASARI
jgi:hypothetical protein